MHVRMPHPRDKEYSKRSFPSKKPRGSTWVALIFLYLVLSERYFKATHLLWTQLCEPYLHLFYWKRQCRLKLTVRTTGHSDVETGIFVNKNKKFREKKCPQLEIKKNKFVKKNGRSKKEVYWNLCKTICRMTVTNTLFSYRMSNLNHLVFVQL